MILVLPDAERAAYAAARLLATLIRRHGRKGRTPVTFVLSGGRTPGRAYEALAVEQGGRIPWEQVVILWGDERCVPPDDDRSNYRLAVSTGLLAQPWAAVHRMPGELPPEKGARAYESVMRDLFPGEDFPRLDVILLGMGEDGHIASLFPGSAELEKRDGLVTATGKRGGLRRLTLTLPVLVNARNLVLLVTGETKAAAVRGALAGDRPEALSSPVRLLMDSIAANQAAGKGHPTVDWVLDEASASLLQRGRSGHFGGSMLEP